MSGIRDTATVTLNVNGAQAKQFMADLEKQIQDTEAAIVDMQKKMADPKDIEKAKKQLKTYKKQLDEMRSATEGVNRALENIELATPRELEKALRTLNRQLKDMVPGSEVWDSHIEKIRELKARLSDIKDEMGEQQSLWEKFNDWATQVWPSIDLLSRGYDALVSGMRNYVDAYADMEQEMANVRKFTGMTEEQVASLNEEFKKIDTRSSREQLNLLAQEAGRLGKTSEEDVLGFVRAADKINVALDDLGEGATLTLSKLTGIFGDEARYGTEQSLLKVGSVINELSQNCSASAPYLANFAERMGGVGAQARLTIPQIMGFAAVLDTNAQKVEASATALSQIIVRLYQDPSKYAKVAGLDAQEFATLMREDANAALLLFLETLQKAGGMDQLSPMFKDMGENGSRAIAALSTLATHIDQVRAQQEAANTAFEEGTSIDNEFAVQNNTVQAALEKCKNRANELRVELGSHLYPIMSHFLTTGSAIMRVLLTTIRFIVEHKAAVMALAAAVTAYIVVMKSELIIKKLRNALDTLHYAYLVLESKATKALTLVTEGLRLAYFKLTGQTTKAMVAQKAFSAAMAATPWGAILTAISAALIAFKAFDDEVESSVGKMDALKRGQEEANAKLVEEKTLLEQNIKTIENFNGTKSQEQALIAQLNDKYGTFFGTCSTLDQWYHTLTKSGNDYCNSIYQQILLEAKRQQALDLAREANENREKGLRGEGITNGDVLYTFIDNLKYLPSWDHLSWNESYDDVYRRNKTYYDQIADNLEARAKQMMLDYAQEVANIRPFEPPTSTTTPTTTYTPITTTPTSQTGDRFAVEKAAREQAEAVAKISYYQGQSDYETYTKRMDEIAVNYFQMLLERTDLSANERLSIQAQYWDAVNKQTKAAHQQTLDEENDSYAQTLYNLNESLRTRLAVGNLSAEERENAEKTHREAEELAELNHLSRLIEIYDQEIEARKRAGLKYDDVEADRLKAQQVYQSAQIAALKRHQQEYEAEEAKFAKIKADYFGDNPQERQQKYDTAFEALKIVYQRELDAAGDNAAEKLRIEEAFLQAQNELRRQYGLISEEDTRSSMERAIANSLEWLNSDGGKALTGTISTLTSGLSSIFSGLSTMMQAELEIQTAQIEKRYDREIRLAQGNSYKVAKLEKKKEAEIAKAKNDANKKMFAMQVIQAVAQTAQNAISAYGSAAAIPVVGYILAPVAAAMAVAAGAIQIAAIKKQQQAAEAKGYSSGGFTKPGRVDEPAGIVHAGEWVASQKLLANPVARPMIETLDYVQRTNTIGSLRAEDVSRSITANNSLVRISESNDGMVAMLAVASKMSGAVSDLTDRLNEPFVTVNTVTGSKGIKSAQDEYDRLMSNKSPKSKRNGSYR